jgi:5-methylcytosine-specific restriction endonuclease McrA
VRCACVYCGVCSLRVQIEHVISRARGGSNRVSNLTAAGAPCNPEKGARPVEEFKLLHPRTALCLAVRLSSPG